MSTNYGMLQNGLEVRHPLGFPVKDLEPDVGFSFIYYYLFPSAKFSLPGGSPLEVSNQFEFGIDVGSPQANHAVDLRNRKTADRRQLPLRGRPDRREGAIWLTVLMRAQKTGPGLRSGRNTSDC
jgi:hypothetical protein